MFSFFFFIFLHLIYYYIFFVVFLISPRFPKKKEKSIIYDSFFLFFYVREFIANIFFIVLKSWNLNFWLLLYLMQMENGKTFITKKHSHIFRNLLRTTVGNYFKNFLLYKLISFFVLENNKKKPWQVWNITFH